METYCHAESTQSKEADSTSKSPKLDVEVFARTLAENCSGITRAELNPHILHKIFGLDVEQTSKPVVYSAFTGSGKTVGLCEWLSSNYKQLDCKLVIAFKELELAAEFITMFNGRVKERSENERKKLNRHISYVFGVDHEQIEKIRTKLDNDKGNEMLCKVLNFLSHTDATTSLCKDKLQELAKAKVVITTHASAHNLACAGVIKGADIVYDEAPADCYHIHELTVGESKETHLAKFTSCATSIDLALSGPKRIGKLLTCKVWASTEVYHLTDADVSELSNSKLRNHPPCGSPSRFGGVNTEQVVDCEVGLDPRFLRPSPNISTGGYKAKAGDFTHFFVSYLDFSSFGANSVTIMTACPEATSVAVLEKLSGEKFLTVEGEVSKARRSLVASKAKLFGFSEVPEFRSISTSKANSASKAAKIAVRMMATTISQLCKAAAFVIAHGWRAVEFQKLGIKTCKSNQTGSNSFRDCTVVGVVNLDFMRPKDRIIEQHIFGVDYQRREKYVMAGGLGQSVMRSALRLKEPLETVVAYFDDRVKELWGLFIGEVV
jgi:hypothetical protein